MSRGIRRTVTLSVLAVAMLSMVSLPAVAHPLGNFTTNSYVGVTVSPEQIAVEHVLDLAEIPTLQTRQQIDLDEDGAVDAGEAQRYQLETCEMAATTIGIVVDDESLPLTWTGDGQMTFPPGEAGLDTLRLVCRFVVDHRLSGGATNIVVTQPDLGGRIGWREITLSGDDVTVIDASVPSQGVSERLTVYPEERIAAPLDVRSATATVQRGAGGEVGLPIPAGVPDGVSRGLDRVSSWFTGLVAVERLTLPFALLAVVVASLLGTLHALAPGHGKTVMAAYLVGRQGTTRDAFLLGGTVAVTHTLGVFLLGVVLSASTTASPERIYPWLGAGSGLLFALVGVTLLRQALQGGHDHHHGPGGHTHGPSGHTHGPGGHTHDPADHTHGDRASVPGASTTEVDVAHRVAALSADTQPDHAAGTPSEHELPHRHDHLEDEVPRRSTGWKGLLAPGLAGGLVPSPSALLVLLGGFAIGRAWFGVGLVVAYGVGMAATLVGAGYLLLRARHRLQRAVEAGGRWTRAAALFRWLPVATSALIIIGGIVIVGRSLVFL